MNDRMKKALATLYQHKADIAVRKPVKEGSVTKQKSVPLHSDIPCRVSLKGLKATERGVTASVEYDGRLYLSPDLNVPKGAEITVTDINGRVTEYIGSRPFGYSSHQEIYLQYKDKVK
ncbi:hypothetical protein [Lactococcus petauri]|uniref:hypothetical protein n=1 Tax=Lactococcus petauri TaxID=1940789 RepID=UPI002549E02E|nr:hypothetical protein [Lactococcus petauri]